MNVNLNDLDPGLGLDLIPVGAISPVGSYNCYSIAGLDLDRNRTWLAATEDQDVSGVNRKHLTIVFQDGRPDQQGVNGATIEAYLLACGHRLAAFQSNPLTTCPENEVALDAIKQAVYALNQRTIRLSHEAELKIKSTS